MHWIESKVAIDQDILLIEDTSELRNQRGSASSEDSVSNLKFGNNSLLSIFDGNGTDSCF